MAIKKTRIEKSPSTTESTNKWTILAVEDVIFEFTINYRIDHHHHHHPHHRLKVLKSSLSVRKVNSKLFYLLYYYIRFFFMNLLVIREKCRAFVEKLT